MSQFFDQASLVMVPSGYKTGKVYSQKPLSADGELTFTRASDASRVNSLGLIEKVRTNLLPRSNDFTTTWGLVNSTATSGQMDKDGGTDAWLISWGASQGSSYIYQAISNLSTPHTASCWVKGTAGQKIKFGYGVNVAQGTDITFTGNWQRISHTSSSGSTLFFSNFISGNASSFYVQYCQSETGDIATDYIPTTTSARSTFAGITVDGTSVPNVPRLNYSGGASCPKLLLEPQRTNLALYSEQLDNAAWVKTRTSVTANATTSPDGYTNADKIVEDTTASASHFIRGGSYSLTSGTTYTFSIFVKSTERQFGFNFDSSVGADSPAIFNLSTGAVVTSGSFTTSITSYTNGWYRCTGTFTSSATTTSFVYVRLADSGSTSYTGNGTSGVFAYGAQLEAGSYATSYIPTTTAVTRLADAAYKTGISSLIGQTEGTMFADFIMPPAGTLFTHYRISGTGGLYNNSQNITLTATNQIRGYSFSGSVEQAQINSGVYAEGTRVKVAYAYKANDFVLYVNGVLIGTDTSGTVPAMSEFLLGSYYPDTSINILNRTNQTLLFKTRLTNAQLAELTAL